MDKQLLQKIAAFQGYTPPVNIDMAKIQVWADPFMTPYDKIKATGMFDQANQLNNNAGVVDGSHIAGTLLRTGLSMAAASFGGKVVGTLFGLSPESQDTLRAQGVLYSGLKGLGII